MQPRQTFLREDVPRRPKMPSFVKGADMEMRFGRQRPAQAFAGQSRPAPGAKPAPGSSRRRIELRYLTLCDLISGVFECDKNRSRRATMLAATLTMAPIHPFRLASRYKPDCAAQATTFELLGCATHNLILSSWLACHFEDITFDRSAENRSERFAGRAARSFGADPSFSTIFLIYGAG